MGKIDNLKEIIKTAIRKELEETNTTASGGDYATPNAFSKDKNSTTNRAVKDSEGIGFTKTKETHKNFVKMNEISNTNKSADYEEIKVGGSKDLGNGYKAKKESESDEGSTWCMYKDGKELGEFDYDQDADGFFVHYVDSTEHVPGLDTWEEVLNYYKKNTNENIELTNDENKNEAAVVYNPTGAASAARYSKVSPQQYSQVVAKALSKRNDRTATFQKAKYIMHNGQPHKMENGKLIPLTKVDHSKDPLYNAIASGKQIKKEGSRPMKAISSEYKALAKKDGLINAANEFVANFGDTTAEELSRIFGIDVSKAKKIISALEVNESLNEGAKELEFFTFLKNEIKQHHGSEVGPALARVKDKFVQLYSGATTEELNEITYKEYKNDPALTSKQKLNIAIKECNRALFEIGRYLKQNKKLREEEGLELSEYWKSTAVKIVQMDERLLNLRREIRNFGLKEIVAKLAEESKLAKKNNSSMKKSIGESDFSFDRPAEPPTSSKYKLQKGDRIKILKKLGNPISRTLDVNPEEWPNEGQTYEIIGIDSKAGMYGMKGKYGPKENEVRWHDIKWIDKYSDRIKKL